MKIFYPTNKCQMISQTLINDSKLIQLYYNDEDFNEINEFTNSGIKEILNSGIKELLNSGGKVNLL